MSVAEPPSITRLPLPEPDGPPPRPKLKKLRLTLILAGLSGLALVSTVFGMMMAVASDLPQLENLPQYRHAQNSTLLDDQGRPLGLLVSNQNRVLVTYDQIAPAMRHAIIAIEDRRFYTNSGVDLRGIGRAFVQDIVHKGSVQGGSTITQQFVKNALEAQGNRTVFEKLREAALAYHLTRKWSKEKILTEYLNAIYFGNGAYGIESAARVYFSADHPGCGTRGQPACASQLRPEEAALLAGMVSNPSGYDPVVRWPAAEARRNVVLRKMLEQGFITPSDYREGVNVTAPPVVQPPREQVEPGTEYFTSWVRQQLVDRFGPRRTFEGGLRVRTTIDLDLQKAAEQAINNYLAYPAGPTAALVAIDNKTGEVRAMVGGRDYSKTPFNLATQGQRQPGSAFKPFVLAAALRKGISPSSTWTSRKKVFTVPNSGGKEKFVVNNYEGAYTGVSTLARATTFSDNSVYADVAFHTGFTRIARMARAMGIRTPVSTNPAISLGGLHHGVNVLDMAHAYETLAHRGQRVDGTLGAPGGGPVGIRKVETPKGKNDFKTLAENKIRLVRVVSPRLADVEVPILGTVVSVGTGVRAQIPGVFIAGKTGTTENYGDAWFVGFTDKLTVAVWVGYPNSVRSMKTEFRGGPVAGGTFPAAIWHDFMTQAISIQDSRAAAERAKKGLPQEPTTSVSTTPVTPAPATTTPATGTGKTSRPKTTTHTPAKTPAPKATPTPAKQPAAQQPSGEDTGGVGAGGGTATP
jgi:penicillin-binding protein 1A